VEVRFRDPDRAKRVEGQELEGQELEGKEVEGKEVEGKEVEGKEVEGKEVEARELEKGRISKGRKYRNERDPCLWFLRLFRLFYLLSDLCDLRDLRDLHVLRLLGHFVSLLSLPLVIAAEGRRTYICNQEEACDSPASPRRRAPACGKTLNTVFQTHTLAHQGNLSGATVPTSSTSLTTSFERPRGNREQYPTSDGGP
jgi:hypothetical protein